MQRVKVAGQPRQRGRQLGEELRAKLHATWEFYGEVLFSSVPFDLEAEGHAYRAAIAAFRADYGAELEGFAEGGGLAPWQLAVLNARTELMHRSVYRAGPGECTSLYFPRTGVLAQNWDWMDALEDLMVLVEIEREDGHRILQLTEPGMLGKIGLNSAGLGVCLNILSGCASAPAVPVHVLLRAVLDSTSLAQARDVVEKADFGTCSHLLLADDRGGSCSLELYGGEAVCADYGAAIPLHTNHYLAVPRDQGGDDLLPNSHARFSRAGELLEEMPEQSIDEMKRLLLDREGEDAICADWFPLGPIKLGTVCGIVMDLPARELHITDGNPRRHPFRREPLAG